MLRLSNYETIHSFSFLIMLICHFTFIYHFDSTHFLTIIFLIRIGFGSSQSRFEIHCRGWQRRKVQKYEQRLILRLNDNNNKKNNRESRAVLNVKTRLYTEKTIIIILNIWSCRTYKEHPHNGIKLTKWTGEPDDRQLLDLMVFLESNAYFMCVVCYCCVMWMWVCHLPFVLHDTPRCQSLSLSLIFPPCQSLSSAVTDWLSLYYSACHVPCWWCSRCP